MRNVGRLAIAISVTAWVIGAAPRPASAIVCTITGTSGIDWLIGTAGADVICGLGGDDHIDGNGGIDTLIGGDGNDTFVLHSSDESVDGGPDEDTITQANDVGIADPVTVYLLAGTGYGRGNDTFTNIEDVVGTPYDDVIFGDGGPNTLDGGQGGDVLDGQGGTDSLLGGENNDVFFLHGGDETVDGWTGEDVVIPDGTLGTGVVIDLVAGTGSGQGTDTFANIEDAAGTDHDDSIVGNGGPNVIGPGAGHDTVDAGGGNDEVDALANTGSLDGGPGVDTVSYAGVLGVGATIDAGSGVATVAGQTTALAHFESYRGTPVNDTLIGSSGGETLDGLDGTNTIRGRGGNDVLYGGSGSDTVDPGPGNDAVDAGAGFDTLDLSKASKAVTADLDTGFYSDGPNSGGVYSIERVLGSRFADKLAGSSAAETFVGSAGNDTFRPRGGDDRVLGGVGIDTTTYADATGGVAGDLSSGTVFGAGADLLFGIERLTGSRFEDNLVGSPFADVLSGLGGDDQLIGGEGNDRLLGAKGNDRIAGGPGTDVCKQGPGHGPITGCP